MSFSIMRKVKEANSRKTFDPLILHFISLLAQQTYTRFHWWFFLMVQLHLKCVNLLSICKFSNWKLDFTLPTDHRNAYGQRSHSHDTFLHVYKVHGSGMKKKNYNVHRTLSCETLQKTAGTNYQHGLTWQSSACLYRKTIICSK